MAAAALQRHGAEAAAAAARLAELSTAELRVAAAPAQAVEEDKKPKLLEAEPEGLVGEVAYEEGRYVRRDTRKGPSGE